MESRANLWVYYGKGYYSYNRNSLPWWWQRFNKMRTSVMLGNGSLAGKILLAMKKPWYGKWLSAMKLQVGDFFLDVGCGAGNFIRELQLAGLQCTGIDPFLSHDEDTSEGVHLRRQDITEVSGRYNGIMFRHSLEHIVDPRQALICSRKCLKRGGSVVVILPLADSLAFWRYGADWFQLDAPRHINLFTKKSLDLLAQECGFKIAGCWYDSKNGQFLFSEEYRMGICRNDPRSFSHDSKQTHFSRKDIARFSRWAKWVNEMGVGDSAAFLLLPQE